MPEHCQNCDAVLTGRFCAACGQRVEYEVHGLGYFIGEATADLTHADSRLWRTLVALVFRPGFLTREYFAGRRARYLPPIRLYLVLSVLVFLTSSTIFLSRPVVLMTANSKGVTHVQRVGPARITAPYGPVPASARGSSPTTGGPNCEFLKYDGPGASWIEPHVKSNCYKVAADNGRLLKKQFLQHLPRALFVFLPLLALFMKALYRRPPRHYVEHLLFFVHDHAAAFLLLSVYGLLRALSPAPRVNSLAGFAIAIYLPVYLYRSMRVVYGQSHTLTAVKFATLAVAYVVSAALMVGLLMVYSYLTL
ncbi:MAG TPA: DUF3667 domain-containing protein [Steroidobacteraceae bacterium]|nr:DUF3667 domain-containing protein [Steroidobacteraceae bacterium]